MAVILAPLALVFLLSVRINPAPHDRADPVLDFRCPDGHLAASIFLVYTHTSIVRVFFITAARSAH